MEESVRAGVRALAEQDGTLDATDTPTDPPTLAPQTEGRSAAERPRTTTPKTTQRRPAAQSRPASKPAPAAPKPKPVTDDGPKPGTVTLNAVGDSVMLGAAGAMKDRFGSKSIINAAKNRRWSEAPQVVKDWAHAGKLGRVLVLHLGNNGPMKQADVEAVLKEGKKAEHILLVTVRVNKPWQNEVNDTLRKQAEKHAKVWLVDWQAVSSGHRDWFYSDGTHVTRTGAENYAKLIASKIPPEKTPTPKPTPPPTKKPTPSPTPSGGLLDPD